MLPVRFPRMSRPHPGPVLYVTSRQPEWVGRFVGRNQITGPDSIPSLAPVDFSVKSTEDTDARNFTLEVFDKLFSKKRAPLVGAHATRRLKTYSAQSGYVYQYQYEGYRPLAGRGAGTEFVFTVSADRKQWSAVEVRIPDAAIESWESAHGRKLSSTERYAVAKLSLFQAFDERPVPDSMHEPVNVRAADVEGIMEALGL